MIERLSFMKSMLKRRRGFETNVSDFQLNKSVDETIVCLIRPFENNLNHLKSRESYSKR